MGIEKSRQRPRTCQVVDIECLLLLSTHIVNGDVLYQSLPQLQICVSTEDLAMSTVSTAAVLFVRQPSMHGPDQQLLAACVADHRLLVGAARPAWGRVSFAMPQEKALLSTGGCWIMSQSRYGSHRLLHLQMPFRWNGFPWKATTVFHTAASHRPRSWVKLTCR